MPPVIATAIAQRATVMVPIFNTLEMTLRIAARFTPYSTVPAVLRLCACQGFSTFNLFQHRDRMAPLVDLYQLGIKW